MNGQKKARFEKKQNNKKSEINQIQTQLTQYNTEHVNIVAQSIHIYNRYSSLQL